MFIQSFQDLQKQPNGGKRLLLLLIAVTGLVFVYLNQQFNYSGLFGQGISEEATFVVNKTIRYLLNDNFCILAIYAIFGKRSYVIAGFYVELAGLLILLPVYFVLKLSCEGTTELSSPLLSFYHRLIINPTLMILLILGLVYPQRPTGPNRSSPSRILLLYCEFNILNGTIQHICTNEPFPIRLGAYWTGVP